MYKNTLLVYQIPRLLRLLSPTTSITHSSKVIVDNIMNITLNKLIDCCLLCNESTLNTDVLTTAIKIILPEEIAYIITTYKDIEYESYKDFNTQHVFSASMIRHLLGERLPKGTKIAFDVPMYIACCLEYIAMEIIDLAYIQMIKNKKVKMYPAHICDAILLDVEMKKLIQTLNIKFITSNSRQPSISKRDFYRYLHKYPYRLSKNASSLLYAFINYIL